MADRGRTPKMAHNNERDAGATRDGYELSVEELETVDALVELGIDHQSAREAVADKRVALSLASKVLEEPTPYTLQQIADASGVPIGVLSEMHAATAVVGPYTQQDLEAGHMLAQLLQLFPLDALLRSARARTMALSQVVRSDVSLVRDQIMAPLREAGADDLTVAIALAENAAEFARVSRRLLVFEYRNQLRQTLRHELSVMAVNSDGPQVTACVGFVDLVGYTALAARVDPSGLDDLLDVFEQKVVDAASYSDDVTVVKYLGDAAMFVSSNLRELVDVLLRLVTPTGEDEEVPVRGGLARGDVLLREGDYFGTPVNVAARLTDIARPWSLLADDDLRDELRDHYSTRRIRPVSVRGLGHRRPVSIRASFEVATPPVDDVDTSQG
jgi:adenylate cyclase